MPGPTTEVLNDDLKALRADLHQVEMTLSTALAKLAAEFGLLKWLVGASLLASVSGIASSAYWAGSLSSRVGSLEARADRVDGRLGVVEDRLTKIEARVTAVEGHLGEIDRRLTSIESTLGRILDRLPPKP